MKRMWTLRLPLCQGKVGDDSRNEVKTFFSFVFTYQWSEWIYACLITPLNYPEYSSILHAYGTIGARFKGFHWTCIWRHENHNSTNIKSLTILINQLIFLISIFFLTFNYILPSLFVIFSNSKVRRGCYSQSIACTIVLCNSIRCAKQ